MIVEQFLRQLAAAHASTERNGLPHSAKPGVRKSATALSNAQQVLFNRNVHKPVHKGAASANHAVFIDRCTACTTLVAGRKEQFRTEFMPIRSGGVIGVDRHVLARQVAGPEAAGA